MNQPRQRFPWLALLIGLVLGAAGGWAYAWLLNPVILVNIAPHQLVAEDQREYVVLVAEAYLRDYELDRARDRLNRLGYRGDIAQMVVELADQAYSSGTDPHEARALTILAEALGAAPQGRGVWSGTGQPTTIAQTVTITPTFEGMPSITPTSVDPTATPTFVLPTESPTPDFNIQTPMQLVSPLTPVCDPEYSPGLIEIWVRNELGEGIPGVKILVEWEGQQDIFFTGFKPEIEIGFADFQMEEPYTRYTVTLVGRSEPVVGIESAPCPGLDQLPTFWLVFEPAPAAEGGD